MAGKSLLLTLILCISTLGARAASTRDEIVPAGTLLHCTMDEPNFSSKTAQAGDPVLCHLGPISSFGHSLFPRGAMLSGHLQESKDPGHFVGKGWLQLEFDRIILPGAESCRSSRKIVAAPTSKPTSRARFAAAVTPTRRRRMDDPGAMAHQDHQPSPPRTISCLERRVPADTEADGRRRGPGDAAGACGGTLAPVDATHQVHPIALRSVASGSGA